MKIKFKNPFFSLSLLLFTFYCFLPIMRYLPVINFQLPYFLLCYLLLLLSVIDKGKSKNITIFLMSSIFLLLINYFLFFLQNDDSALSLQKTIGLNFSLFVSTFPILFLLSNKMKGISNGHFKSVLLVILLITSVTTIIGTYMFESPCRELATQYNSELDNFYRLNNIGGYRFIYALVLSIPFVISQLQSKFNIKMLLILIVFVFSIIRSEYTTAILLVPITIFLSVLNRKRGLLHIITIVLVGILTILNIDLILTTLIKMFESVSTTVSTRIVLLQISLHSSSISGDMLERFNTYNLSLHSFIDSPVFGNLVGLNNPIGGHSEFLDLLAHSGLLGFVIVFSLILILRKVFLRQLKSRDSVFVVYFVALVLSIVNPVFFPEVFYVLLVFPFIFNNSISNVEGSYKHNFKKNYEFARRIV